MAKRPIAIEGPEGIADRLEITREALDLNQADFARRLGISQQAYTNYKKMRRIPSWDQARRMCQAIGLSLDWIFRGDLQAIRGDLQAKILHIMATRKR